MTPPANIPVAVAVVSWNTRDLLDDCLTSLRPDHDAGRAEVWVVDNGSSDGSPEMVAHEHPWVRLLQPEENLGYGPAVNLVAAQTTSAWVAASNADVVLEPGALEALLTAGARHPEAGSLAPRLLLPDGTTQPAVQPFPSVWAALALNVGAYRLSPRIARRLCLRGAWRGDRAAAVDWATGAFLLVRRSAWDDAGGFDAAQWMYAEDLDLAWRVRRAGWTNRYEPAAVVHHRLSAAAALAFGDESARGARWMAANYVWMMRRRGLLQARLHAAIYVAGAAARIVALTPSARAGGSVARERRSRAQGNLVAHRIGLRSRSRVLESAGARPATQS